MKKKYRFRIDYENQRILDARGDDDELEKTFQQLKKKMR